MKRVLFALLFAAILIPATVSRSGATFVAGSANPGAQFVAALNFNTVSVSLTNPGSPLRGSVPVTAAAASNRGIATVVFSSAPAGTSTWTVACTKTVAPYTCTFDTTAVADGLRDVRAVATDSAGYTLTDTVTNRRVDNTAPAATTTDPGSPLTGSVNLTSTATDTGGSGLASQTIQYRATAGAWIDVCTAATSPLTCAWNTTALADGLWDLRTVATDVAGNQGTSAPVFNRRVDNTAPTVSLTDPGASLKGTVTLASTTADGAGSGVSSVRYEYKLTTGSTWATACTSATTPFSCTFNTASVGDNRYDFRAVATDGVAKVTTSTALTARWIDNAAPTAATLGAVATPLQNTVALTGTATDPSSGIASLRFQYSPAGTGTWTDICTDTTFAYTCSFDTTGPADGLYDMRTLATDLSGNTTPSTVQTNRRIDNDGPTVAMTNPLDGSYISGTLTVSGTATDPVGVTTTSFEYRQGAGAWNAVCTDTATPYSCAGLDSTQVPDGTYSGRMTATDTLGHTSTSAVMTFQVDNTRPTATSVQGTNGGTAGTMNALDSLTFGYSEIVDPTSILAGWDGSLRSTGITARVTNNGAQDTLEVFNGATELGLTGSLNLFSDYVSNTVVFNASIQRIGTGNTFVVTLGTVSSGAANIRINVAAANMVWTSSTAAKDLAGNTATGNLVTETGANDRDF